MRTVFFAYTDTHGLTSRLSLSIHTVVRNTPRPPTPYPTMSPLPIVTPPTHPPGQPDFVSRRYPGPAVCLSNTVYYSPLLPRIPGKALFPGLFCILRHKTKLHAISLTCLSVFLSFTLRDRNSGYTPRARPRALTGLRLPAVGSHNTCFHWRTYGCQ